MTPTIGNAVYFQPVKSANTPLLAQPFAATVAYVHHDRCINIGYLDRSGASRRATSVPFLHDGDPVPATGYFAHWPAAKDRGQA